MKRFLFLLTILAGTTVLLGFAAKADKRVALVVGNSSYRPMPELKNAGNDAEDVEKLLKGIGFETMLVRDLNRGQMNEALDRFSRVVAGADVAVVYYAGHGMQFGSRNYLMPIDAQLDRAEDINRFRLLPVEDVLEILGQAQGARILILDACRNNPLEVALKRQLASVSGTNRDGTVTRGLERMSASNGTIIAYATQANDVANDGTARNSPFTQAFLKHAAVPDIDVRQCLAPLACTSDLVVH